MKSTNTIITDFSDTVTEHPANDERRQRWPWTVDSKEMVSFDTAIRWPKISIVTPSFNQGAFIEETIRSVLLQGYPNLEYIIIDGGSTDNTLSIIKKYDTWITYWVSEPDRGQSHAINKGLKRCTGEIFNWLNSDDWYLPDTFFNIATAFLKNPSIQVLSGFENHINMDGSVSVDRGTFLAGTIEETIELCQLTQPSTFFKTELLRQIGFLPEDIHYIMDGEIWVRILLLYGHQCFLKISKPLVNFRLHENSKTISNLTVDNFLIERSSMIIDLQTFIGVPAKVTDFWTTDVYNTPNHYKLNRQWLINKKIITSKRLQRYFIRKYINLQFQRNNLRNAHWGLKFLLSNFPPDYFIIKGFIKLLGKGRWHE